MTHQALCQDCLRAPAFTSADDLEKAHAGETNCTCGGDLCACDGCLETIRRLAAGQRGQIEGIARKP